MDNMRKTIYIRLLTASLMAAIATACAKDDTAVSGLDTTEGISCTVTLNIGASPAPEITVTRANNSLSRLSSIMIFVYNADGRSCQQVVERINPENNGNYSQPTTETLYKVSFETTTGKKQLLAVANYIDNGYWTSIDELRKAAEEGNLSIDGLRDGLITLTDQTNADGNIILPNITASNQMLISGWNKGVVFAAGQGTTGVVTNYGENGDDRHNVAIKMQRSMARVTFVIPSKSSTKTVEGVTHTTTFTPSTFRVYNFPKSSLLTQTDETRTMADAQKDSGQEYLTSAVTNVSTNTAGDYTFSFYMPENVQESGKATSYDERDMWNDENNGAGTQPEDKVWTNAPQNSTFVVINGTYEETKGANNERVYTADVSYTVHLGDFSGNTNFDDFSVVRNYRYTYNMSVKGVDKIVVEAKKEGDDNSQAGAEGDVYDATSCVYNYQLDAHYEQVYLQYDLSNIAASLSEGLSGQELDDAIADKLILVIQSEAMDYTGGAGNVANKRGSLKPYKIYADAVRDKVGQDATNAASAAKAEVMDDDPNNTDPTTPKKGFDYKWIEFWPQTGTALASYPGTPEWSLAYIQGVTTPSSAAGESHLMDVYDVIVAMGNVIKKIYNNNSGSIDTADYAEDGITVVKNGDKYYARFTAFVNEYYYYKHPLTEAPLSTWSVITNKIPREMIIAMSTDVSEDGNSSYSRLHSYISQLSMQTFYSSRSMALNAFGIESYNETPLSFKFATDDISNDPSLNYHENRTALTQSDGRYNQIRLLGFTPSERGTYGDWNKYIKAASNGYSSTTTADRASHKLPDAYNMKYAYSACLSRNRDLNGDGKIDDNEIRWYLPSVNEYIRMGIGTNAVSNMARLYMGAKGDMVKSRYPNSYTTDGALYYTSSRNTYSVGKTDISSGQRIYWAVERGAYGGDDGAYHNIPIRCIRILPAIKDGQDATAVYDVKSDPTYEWDANKRILKFKGRLIDDLYRQYVSETLDPHNEDDAANSFYEGIYVAKEDVYEYVGEWWDQKKETKKFPLAQIINYGGNQTNPCAGYHESGDRGAVWRVPNLVEFSALVAEGLIDQNKENACCTQFSNMDVRFGFAFSSLVYCPGGGSGDTTVDKFTGSFAVRCVRDVPAGTI